jgi:hypothetical protein
MSHPMNDELARLRRDDLLREAAQWRASAPVRARRTGRAVLRGWVAAVARPFGQVNGVLRRPKVSAWTRWSAHRS